MCRSDALPYVQLDWSRPGFRARLGGAVDSFGEMRQGGNLLSSCRPFSITTIVIVLAVVIVTFLIGRFRARCPYQNPLCRPRRPCLLCYRDLFRASDAKRGAG